MSRSTQFIGLTDDARAFVGGLEAIGRYVGAHGMFGEDIELGQWRDADGNRYREVVQADPWSSGPCIFTCLEMRFASEEEPAPGEALAKIRAGLEAASEGTRLGPSEASELLDLLDALGGETRLFEWVRDPTLRDRHQEMDPAKGTYWI